MGKTSDESLDLIKDGGNALGKSPKTPSKRSLRAAEQEHTATIITFKSKFGTVPRARIRGVVLRAGEIRMLPRIPPITIDESTRLILQ